MVITFLPSPLLPCGWDAQDAFAREETGRPLLFESDALVLVEVLLRELGSCPLDSPVSAESPLVGRLIWAPMLHGGGGGGGGGGDDVCVRACAGLL